MNWYHLFAKGHHGYPQPEDTYDLEMYESVCQRCGIHGAQISPIRLRATSKAPHSDFIQINWVFDLFLIRPELEHLLVSEGFTSISFRPVLEHRSGHVSESMRQLCINQIIDSVEVSRLPKVTCIPQNEESKFDLPGPKRYPPETSYCHRVKSHPPTTVALSGSDLSSAPDVFQTGEWFGSGGAAFRLTICSERFKHFVLSNKLRGLGFNLVQSSGYSTRAT